MSSKLRKVYTQEEGVLVLIIIKINYKLLFWGLVYI